MLKRLLLSSSCPSRHLICQHKPTNNSLKVFNNSDFFPFSWPLSIVLCRPIKFSRIFAMADGPSSKTASSEAHKHRNRLALEHSPYLLQHAHNPVNWYPWSEEAFSEARKRDVPIFLSSIAYSPPVLVVAYCLYYYSVLYMAFYLTVDYGIGFLCAVAVVFYLKLDTAHVIGTIFDQLCVKKLVFHFHHWAAFICGYGEADCFWATIFYFFLLRCHVMEVESFENEDVAKLLNDWFISIKVDREERPDVDKVYMTYVQALYGGGGWPLSVFLSPDLKPLMGGTYFPPDDKYGRPGFKTVLRKVKEAWDNKKDELVQSGTFAIEQLSEALSATARSEKLAEGLHEKALQNCAEQLADSYDSKFGGFGSAPKFPRPVEIQLMLYHSKKLKDNGMSGEAKEDLSMVVTTLQYMARGGIHDIVGGGFHRYSVDECWHVPHFEKMLYDQGQLANVYLDIFSITKDVVYSSVSRDILDYLRRDMIGPNGEIFSAEDADSSEFEGASGKKEGAFYIWSSREVEDILGENAPLFKEHYYIKESGNCDLSRMSDPHNEFKGKNVLIERNSTSATASKFGMSVEECLKILGTCRQKLFDVRSKRPRPHLDDKVIVSWNGLAISSFARASKILKVVQDGTQFHFPIVGTDPKEYLEVAEKAAAFIRKNLYNQQTRKLKHSFRNGPSKAPGFLDDYAFLISGLLDLYEFGSSIFWLAWAMELQEVQDELFLDKDGGGYFNTQGDDPSVLLRVKEDHDGAEPSGNSVSVINLVRLASFIANGYDHYRHKAERLLAVFEKRLTDRAMAVPLMCCAADMLAEPSRKQVVLVGNKSSPGFDSMLTAAHTLYNPNKTVIHIDPIDAEEMGFWNENNEKIASMAKSNFTSDKVVALVCQNFTCSPLVHDPKSLESLLLK